MSTHKLRLSQILLAAALPGCATVGDDAIFVNPGVLYAPTYQPTRSNGFGGEISSVYYRTGASTGYGPLVQGEWIPSGDNHTGASRFALGMQGVGGPLGVDAGWAVRSSGGSAAPWATGPQLGAFFSIAQASIGVRLLLPIAHGASEHSEVGETSMVLTAKVPLLVYGEMPEFNPFRGVFNNWGRMPSGRPLEVDNRVRVASLERTTSWVA